MQLSEQEREAVIDTMMGEARGEGYLGLAAVAKAISNRADVRGISMADVVGQKDQFDGSSYSAKTKDAPERELAEEALDAVLAGEDPAQIGIADHFATTGTKTSWTEAYKDTAKTVGGHTFYSSPQAQALGYASVAATPQAKPEAPFEAVLGNTQNSGLRDRTSQAPTARGNPFGRPDAQYTQQQELAPLGPIDGLFDYGLQTQQSRTVNGKTYDRSYFDINNMDPATAYAARNAFDALGINPSINSSYRGPGYNAAVGGRPGSQHKNGKALDISVTDMNTQERAAMVDALMERGFQGIGVGPTTIHADTRGRPAMWDYGNSIPAAISDVYTSRTAGNRLNQYPSVFTAIPSPPERPSALTAKGPTARNGPRGSRSVASSAPGIQATATGVGSRSPAHSATVTADLSGRFGPSRESIIDGYTEYANSRGRSFGPSRDAIVDGYQEYAQSRMSGLQPLETPQTVASRPGVAAPSFNFSAVTATPGTKPTTNTTNAPASRGIGVKDAFGNVVDAVTGLRDNVTSLPGKVGLTPSKNKAVDTALTLGGAVLGGPVGMIAGKYGVPAIGRAAKAIAPALGALSFGTPSTNTQALGYARDMAIGNPAYTQKDFLGNYMSAMRGLTGNPNIDPFGGMPRDGAVAAYNQGLRDQGLAIGVMEGLSRDLAEAFGGGKSAGGKSGSGGRGGSRGGGSSGGMSGGSSGGRDTADRG